MHAEAIKNVPAIEALEADPTLEGEEWDDEDREHLDLPVALKEVELNKFSPGDDLDVAADEDVAVDGDKEVVMEAECYSKLKRLWQQELACPELLPLDEETLKEITEELESREQAIAELGEQSGDIETLLGSVLKVDTDRARFMLSDLLRARIWKIQQHPMHMRDLIGRMSDAEVSQVV